MAKNDRNQRNEILTNTQKVLFAEDLVNYILQKNSLPGILLSTERQEESGVSIFDNNFKMTANCIYGMYENYTEHIFNFMMDNKLNNIPWFAHYANTAKSKFLKDTPYPEGFLHYSVHLAQLAGKLCEQEIDEAPRMVVRYMVEALDLFGFGVKFLDAQEIVENRQSIDKFEQPPPYRKDDSLVEATEDHMCITDEQLNRCESTTEDIYEEVMNIEEADEEIRELLLCVKSHLERERKRKARND